MIPSVEILLVLGSVAVIAVLMAVGMRQRWIPAPREAWIPGARGRWEPEIPPRWDEPEGRPLPSVVWVLAAIGWGAVLVGLLLATLFRQPWIGYAGLAIYVATWIARMIITRWIHASGPLTRAAAVIQPLALVAGFALAAQWPGWIFVGGALYVSLSSIAGYIERRYPSGPIRRSSDGQPSE
jgi:hypothetical protein